MKKLSAALITFIVGTAAFNLLEMKSVGGLKPAPEQRVAEVSKTPVVLISYESVPDKKDKIRRPFFDSFGEDEANRYFRGWFIPNRFKKMPEVWTILLDRDDSGDGESLWAAMVLTNKPNGESNDDDIFESVQMRTEGSHLSFKTNKIRGIEYQFDGNFLRSGSDFSEDEKVLRGTMRKIVRGEKVAEFTADFAYAEPHCFH